MAQAFLGTLVAVVSQRMWMAKGASREQAASLLASSFFSTVGLLSMLATVCASALGGYISAHYGRGRPLVQASAAGALGLLFPLVMLAGPGLRPVQSGSLAGRSEFLWHQRFLAVTYMALGASPATGLRSACGPQADAQHGSENNGNNMNLVSTGAFDRLQQALATELLRTIRMELEKVDAPEDLVEQLTGSIGFAVASLLDDVAGFEVDGESVSPLLTFLTGEKTLECERPVQPS